jgi:hypothetical protein
VTGPKLLSLKVLALKGGKFTTNRLLLSLDKPAGKQVGMLTRAFIEFKLSKGLVCNWACDPVANPKANNPMPKQRPSRA